MTSFVTYVVDVFVEIALPCLKRLVHVGCCQDIMSFVAVTANGPLYWADDAITDIFAKLRFRKVIPKIKNKAAATLAVLF